MPRRLATLIATVALMVTGLGLSPAPDAHAALYNIFPADADGTPQGTFYADDALFATMTSDLAGGVVCIVAEEVTNPSASNYKTGFVWGKPHTYIGIGTLLGYPLSAPPLPVGKWRLLITDPNGKPGKELSEVFEVRPCRATCDTSAAESQLAPWKAKAATAMDTVETLEYIAAADKAMSMYNNLSSVLTDVVKGGGPVGVMMGIGTGMIEGMFANAWDTSKNQAMSILRPLYATSWRMWGDISRDPPRDDYGTATQPVFGTVPILVAADFTPTLTASELATMNTYAQLTTEATAYGDASRLANERYMGAAGTKFGAPDWAAAASQAKAASAFTFQLNQRLRALQEIQPMVSAMAWAKQPIFADAEQYFDIPAGESVDEYFQRLLASIENAYAGGLAQETRSELLACSFYEVAPVPPATCPITEEMIAYTEGLWQQPSYAAGWHRFDATVTPAAAISASNVELGGIIDAYDLFGRWMGLKAGEAQAKTPGATPNRQPVSAFTASATTGTAPLTVMFTSTATDPDKDVLSLKWDIAGARSIQGEQTVTHTFTSPGEYWISLVATDPGGLWHQAIKKITVYPSGAGAGNQAPVADFTPQAVNEIGPFDQTFTATSTDPDSDTLTHTWYFGDGTSYTGDTVTKTFEPGYVMSVLLVVSDGKLSAQASGEVTSRNVDGSDPANTPPVASFTANPNTGTAPLQVLFTSTSTDVDDADILTHTWYFGDGQQATGAVAPHTYQFAGTYTVTLVVSDGKASTSATQTVTVTGVVLPVTAGFTIGKAYDATDALNGAAVLDNGVSQRAGNPVTNVLGPSGDWFTVNGVTDEQEVIIRLAGRGADLVDRVGLTGYNVTTSVKEFSLALTTSANPFGTYTTVINHKELASSTGVQEFTFTPQVATFAKLTVHSNYGGNYFRLREVSMPTIGRDGGIVSLDAGTPATVESSSSEYSGSYTAANILKSDNTYWSTPYQTVANQAIRVKLGGNGPHTVGSIALRATASTRSLKDFEVWVSETADDSGFSKVFDGTLENNASLQEFSFTPHPANYVELRLKNNHGDPNYLYLYEMRVLTTDGLNVADGAGVGAQVVDYSGAYGGYQPANILAPQQNNGWIGESGHITDQYVTVLLRDGAMYPVDHVSITPGTYRAKNVEIQVSMDGAAFTTVATQQLLNVADEHTITFPAVTARYVRLMIKDGYHGAYVGVQKFRVFSLDRGSGTGVPFVDISTGTPTQWAWDFGDGTTSTDQHPMHTFPGPGAYPITLTVTDAVGETDTTHGSYTVPATPTLGVRADSYTVNEGANTSLAATTDGAEIVAWQWDLDYTQPTTTASTLSARFPDDGTYVVKVRGLTADWLWTSWFSQNFAVLNVAPTVHAGSPVTGLAMSGITPVVRTVSDPGADVLTCTWDWGDDTAKDVINDCTLAKSKISHQYALPGVYTAILTADDGEGGIASATVVLTAQMRPTFLQVMDAHAVGSDVSVTVRLNDMTTGTPAGGQDLVISADGNAAVTGTTDAEGDATVTLNGASAADSLTATFSGSALYQAADDLTRRVRAPKADIVFMVDESGSMGGKQAAIRANLQFIVQRLGASLDYRVGVVGYANGDTFGRVITPITASADGFVPGISSLVAGGGSANGYEAMVVASGYRLEPNNAVTGQLVDTGLMIFRDNAASCAVLITDAQSNEAPGAAPKTTRAHAEAALASRGTTLYSIMTKDQTSLDAYGPGDGLAGQTGGQAWDVQEFAKDPTAVLAALVQGCVTKASTPDLAVAVAGDADAAPGDEVVLAVTTSNLSTIHTPAIALALAIPTGLQFVSAEGGGTFDPDTKVVSWPTFDLDAGAHADRRVTLRVPAAPWSAGEHPFTLDASVNYNGSLGAESNTENNAASHTVTVALDKDIPPDPGDPGTGQGTGQIGIGTEIDESKAPAPGGEVTYPLTVTYSGAGIATDVVVLQQVSDRFEITNIDIPDGWENGYDASLVGPHPDGQTAGTWIYLKAASVNPENPPVIQVTSELKPLEQGPVVDDVGVLDANLPALARVPPGGITSIACVTATQNDAPTHDCADVVIPVKDIVANVTVRLSGGITYLIVSVNVTAALVELPITLTWTPSDEGAVPAKIVMEGLLPGRHYVITWPGGATDASGVATAWPGWRAVTDDDRDENGKVLDPATGEVIGDSGLTESPQGLLLLDPTLGNQAWRAPSTLAFSVNPTIQFTVSYRESLKAGSSGDPGAVVPDPSGPGSQSGGVTDPQISQPDAPGGVTDPQTAAPQPAPPKPLAPPQPDAIDVEGVQQSVGAVDSVIDEVTEAGPALAATGPSGIVELTLFGLLLLLLGFAVHLRVRPRKYARR